MVYQSISRHRKGLAEKRVDPKGIAMSHSISEELTATSKGWGILVHCRLYKQLIGMWHDANEGQR